MSQLSSVCESLDNLIEYGENLDYSDRKNLLIKIREILKILEDFRDCNSLARFYGASVRSSITGCTCSPMCNKCAKKFNDLLHG